MEGTMPFTLEQMLAVARHPGADPVIPPPVDLAEVWERARAAGLRSGSSTS
jgi:hypothetical protein